MFVKLKKPKQYKKYFLNPEGIHKVYMVDRADGLFYMLKCDGEAGLKIEANQMDDVVFEEPGLPWRKNTLMGYINVSESDVIVIEKIDNESLSESILRPMEAFS